MTKKKKRKGKKREREKNNKDSFIQPFKGYLTDTVYPLNTNRGTHFFLSLLLCLKDTSES